MLRFFIFIIFYSVGLMAADTERGLQVYQEYCATCHGDDLKGGMAQSLVDGVWQFGSKDSHVFRNVKYGIPDRGMPGFEDALVDDDINAVIAFMQAEEKMAGIDKPVAPQNLQTLDYNLQIEVWQNNLDIPWAIDFIDEQTALITERPGTLYLVKNGERFKVEDSPIVLHEGQGGLLDVAVDPDYADNQWIYLAYSHMLNSNGDRPPAMTRIVRGRIVENRWTDQQVVFEAKHEHYSTRRHHYGCRIVFDPDGYLYFAIGDRGAQDQAQDITRPNGKTFRINRDGSIPKDNPFAKSKDAYAGIFTFGNRNIQGMAVHPQTGHVWTTEHGPMGGDELNLLSPGANYGWPEISYGINYNGTIITDFVRKDGMAQPNYYWRPSTAVCGLDFYRGKLFPKWNNKLLVGALKYEQVSLLDIEGDRIMHEEVILKNLGRVRDVACGPDGAIYVVINQPGMVVRLTPVEE
jgi:glucose/arabinose dehydrogenase